MPIHKIDLTAREPMNSIIRYLYLFALCFTVIFTARAQKLNEDSIKKVIQEAKADTIRVDAMLTYANYLVGHKRDISTGLQMLEDAKALAEKSNYPIGVAQALLTTGNYYRDKNEWEKSMEPYRSIIKMASQIKDEGQRKLSLLKAYNNLGGIYNINGDFTSSLENRLKSVEIIESMPPNPNNTTIACLNTASDYRQLNEYSKAREYINKVTPLLPSIKDFLKLEYYYEYYHILLGNNETAKAVQTLNTIDSLIQKLDLTNFDKLDYGTLSNKLHGDYEMNYTKDYSKAVVYFKKALDDGQQLENATEIASALHNIGWGYFEQKRYPEAITWLQRSYDSASKKGLKNIAFKASSLLSKAYGESNNPAKGLQYSRIAIDLKDSIASSEKVSQLNFLEAKYQYEKKEKEIADLQKTNEQKEFLIRKKNLLFTGSLILLVLLLALAGALYRFYKNRQELMLKEKALQVEKISSLEKQQQVVSLQSMINGQESERTRIAKDLHDGLGGVFSTVKMHFSTLQHDVPELRNNALYKKSYELVDNASDELRKIAQNMMPEVLLKIGLVEALQDFCSNVNASGMLHISLQQYGIDKRLSASTEIMIYRIIQELINNIIKHASATEAIIQFNKDGNRLSITVEDNGRGFDTKEVSEKRSMGIETVKSRVDYLNGRITIDSRKDVGTTVMIDLLIND